MENENVHQSSENKEAQEDNVTDKGNGPQGVDKAPGEEPSTDTDHLTDNSQKGKKVDADPTEEAGQPIKE